MTLMQRENIETDHYVPQWKQELMKRKRFSVKASIYQLTNNNLRFPRQISKQRDVITTNERAVDRSRQPDFHLQKHASLGMSQRFFFPVVDNMKLLNEVGVRDSSVKSRTRVNSSRTDCLRENYVKHVIEMNEEKCFDKFRFSLNKFSSRAKVRSLSPAEEDNTSDSSEELQYGPGIVNKLKTKYMSMTLRDSQKKGIRPCLSNLRKASSLDNLLDEELMDDGSTYQISSVISCVNKLEYSNKESNSCLTVNFCTDMKRARSMENLQEEKATVPNIKSVMINKTKVTNHSKPATVYNNGLSIPLDSIVNEDVIIVENSVSEMKMEDKRRTCPENKELPPPDVVKETLKIFENCQKKTATKNWRQTKSESPKKPICGKPVLYPKPVLENKSVKKTEENGCEEVRLSLSNGKCYERTPLPSIKVNFESKQFDSHHTLTHTTCISNDKSSINVNVKSSISNNSEKVILNGASCKKVTSPLTLENDLDESKSPENECKYRGILKPSEALPVRQIGVIRPLVSSKSSSPPLTQREIENNLINTKKTLDLEKLNGEAERPVIIESPSPQLIDNSVKENRVKENSVNNGSNNITKPSTLWSNKPWNQQQNTMIFNFKDRKEVPDYIENDGLTVAPSRDRAQKILQEGGGTGYIILGIYNGLDNTPNESSTDAPSISCNEDWQFISGPPSPCNIQFEGDNVVINGKSNLRKQPKEKKLRIQFNDTSTTFEYPSEASLLEDDYYNVSTSDDDQSLLVVSSPELLIVPCSTSRISTPLSGGGLANYVPSKFSMGESFELGITKSSSTVIVTTKSTSNMSNGISGVIDTSGCVNTADDYLKPATENENVAWSEESIPDLLF